MPRDARPFGAVGAAGPAPPFASLTSRFLAGVVDITLVALAALFVQLLPGSGIRLAEWSMMALSAGYFILAYAEAGKGYSVGKRLLSIRVVNRNGEPLSLVASTIRWVILVGVALPLGAITASFQRGRPLGDRPAMAIAVPVLGVMLVDSYLFLFNRRTRQSLHDVLAGSYVVPRAHAGPVAAAPIWRGHIAWCAACVAAVAVAFPVPYRWARELVPRSAELLRARERILARHRIDGFFVTPGFATQGADTTWYVSVLGQIDAEPGTEREAEALRLALACALFREAPMTLRGAELFLMVSFARGEVKPPAVRPYIAGTDITPAACAAVVGPF